MPEVKPVHELIWAASRFFVLLVRFGWWAWGFQSFFSA